MNRFAQVAFALVSAVATPLSAQVAATVTQSALPSKNALQAAFDKSIDQYINLEIKTGSGAMMEMSGAQPGNTTDVLLGNGVSKHNNKLGQDVYGPPSVSRFNINGVLDNLDNAADRLDNKGLAANERIVRFSFRKDEWSMGGKEIGSWSVDLGTLRHLAKATFHLPLIRDDQKLPEIVIIPSNQALIEPRIDKDFYGKEKLYLFVSTKAAEEDLKNPKIRDAAIELLVESSAQPDPASGRQIKLPPQTPGHN